MTEEIYQKIQQDPFFNQSHCDRCRNELKARTLSWFTDETICLECSDKETEIKKQMKEKGINPDHYEGWGFIPEINT